MQKLIGRTLGHYRIVDKIGEGGMGEVFRAHDERLDRDVAVKVLPSSVAQDPERLARFEREAKLLASLSHQNIATLHGLEEHEEQRFLVMELAEGETLAERIKRGPVPVEDALEIAKQIAEGLETAHEYGIIHRDLKPANVMVSPKGTVKVLDFGLAKVWYPDESDADLTHSPTLTGQMTAAGVLLGTAAYMSPEQARGKTVDKRADIWALGCVLFEMLAGARAFPGDTVTDTLAAVIEREPDWSLLPGATSQNLVALLRKCLRKEPRRRLRDAGDAWLELEEPEKAPTEAGVEEPPMAGRRSRRWSGWLAAGVIGALGAIIAGGAFRLLTDAPRSSTSPRRLLELPSERRNLDDSHAISPDGSMLAYTIGGQLRIRDLDRLEARKVTGPEQVSQVFWSPDSRLVGCVTATELLAVDARSLGMRTVCPLPPGTAHGVWGTDGFIVISITRGSTGSLFRVSDSGGTLESYLIPEAGRGEYRYAYPTYVGRGETLAFSVYSEDKMESIVAQRDGERLVLSERSYLQNLPFAWSPSGHLLISVQDRGIEIDAVPVHPDTLRVLGPPSRFADDACCASVAADGTVVYATLERAPMGIAVVSPEGSVESALDGSFEELNNPSVSPDGGRIAVLDLRQDRAIWVHDLGTARHARLTFDRIGSVQFAWSPEGNSIVYSNDFEEGALFIARADGGSERERLDVGHLPVFFPHWSPQGDMIAFYVVDPETSRDIALLRLDGDRQAVTVLGTRADEAVPRISPSGRYLAYQSNESGRWEVYVTRLPDAKGRWQVSTDGGIHPRWSRDGGSLYYVSGDSLMQVQVETEPVLRTELPRVALEAATFGTFFAGGWECNYDTAPGGGFVIVTGAGQGKSTMVLAEGLL